MDLKEMETTTTKILNRIKKSWFPLAAVAGALTSFVSASFKTRPVPAGNADPSKSSDASAQPNLVALQMKPAPELTNKYVQTVVLGGDKSPHTFRYSLADIAVGAEDTVYSLGDDEVRIFDSDGTFIRSFKVLSKAACLAVGQDGRVYIGAHGRVGIYSPQGEHTRSITVGEEKKPAAITAIKVLGREILVADATARIIHRYDTTGKQLGVVGDRNKTGSFMLPNGWLDFDVDSFGTIWATDTGRHRVTGWMLDGSPTVDFGKFGMQNASDFVGCCNPVNLAVTPDGNIVTAEKMISRVKVYDPEGTLLALIGPENFDPKCTLIHLAVDSTGRILAADPVRREIKIFAPASGI
jgi:sugar lactone lactonase YvrE